MTPPDLTETLLDAVSTLPETLAAAADNHPLLVFGVAGFVLLTFLRRAAVSGMKSPTDPTRLFSASQKAEGFARASGRCEMDGVFFTRCTAPAKHGDHHYPWSKGGSTSMANFVAACARHNTSKGAKIPTAWATFRMEARRRKYFPQGLSVKAGERFAHR